MIGNLQALRAIAALGVVFYHTGFECTPGVHTDFLGVAVFFVISGFIMCYITRDRSDGFLINRAIRIVPLYWICTAAVITLNYRSLLFGGHTEQSALHILSSLFFLPSQTSPVLGVGWTLNFEIYFYVVFAAALAMSRKFAALIVAAVIITVIEINRIDPGIFLTTYYSHIYVGFFVGGIALFYLWRSLPNLPPRPTAIVLVPVLLLCYAIQFDVTTLGYWTFSLPVLIVGSALVLSRAGIDTKWRPIVMLGDASYAIYLTHTIFMELLRLFGLFDTADSDWLAMAGIVTGAILIGASVHLLIEKPLLSFLRKGRDKFAQPRARTV